MSTLTFHESTISRAATSWYVSRRIGLSQDDATHALGELVRDGMVADDLGVPVVIDTVLHGRPGAARGFTGRLRLRRRGTVRISVEVEPWSRTESAVAIRPSARPPLARAERYFDGAVALLAALDDALQTRVPAIPIPAEARRAS